MNIGVSPLTNRIYAGKSRQIKGGKEGQREWVGRKSDVTDEAVLAVFDHLHKKASETGYFEISIKGYGTMSFRKEDNNA